MTTVTQILKQIESGDAKASVELLPVVYDELRRLATQRLAEEPAGQTLQPTALVHEAYIRLVDSDSENGWDSAGHFFAAAATAMRRILVENARSKRALKRGGGLQRREMDIDAINASKELDDHEVLDEALKLLEEKHPRKARLVDLRYFAGLTMEQAAAALGISIATAERDWKYARAWLHQQLTREQSSVD